MLHNPKKEIYDALCTLGYDVSQQAVAVFNELPAITFTVSSGRVNLDLNNDVARQDITIKIDLWADSSVKCSLMLIEVEDLLRSMYYRLEWYSDIPNIDSDVYHTSSRFVTIV